MTAPDIDSLATYGGAMADYASVEDATTDLGAAYFNKMSASVAAMTHTAPRAVRRFVGHATTPADPSSGLVHDSMWGSASGVKPTVTRNATGDITITWTSTQTDELGVSHTIGLRYAKGWAEGATAYHVQCSCPTVNTVNVRIFDMAGVASDAVGATIVVEVH
jgi:hypothetical protein